MTALDDMKAAILQDVYCLPKLGSSSPEVSERQS
jgi:hypothetical protein